MNKSILFLVNVDWFFISHRLPIALKALEQGYEVHLACGFTDRYEELARTGLKLHPLPLARGKAGAIQELKALRIIYKNIKKINPDIVHCVSIKPVLYGGLITRLLGTPGRVFSISGLGFVFVAQGLLARIRRFVVGAIYRLALGGAAVRVIFQNRDDQKKISHHCKLEENSSILLRGSGVDLQRYPYVDEPDDNITVTLASRLLKDKGVCEFVEAAEILHKRGCKAKFQLVGDIDLHNPATLTQTEIDALATAGIINVTGFCSDIAGLFASSNIVVLPSYREGLPKVLCEAAACGRAVVTTDVPGCRDAVEPGVTGLLVPVRDSVALADAIQKLIDDPALRRSVGKAGRDLAEREFSIDKVIERHMEIYREFIHE